jgi:hypothetical protein
MIQTFNGNGRRVQAFTIPFVESPNCWISIVNNPDDLGGLIALPLTHLIRAISQVIIQPIAEKKWKLDQQMGPGWLSSLRRGSANSPHIMKRSLFGPSPAQSGTYDPRAQLSLTAFHPRDMFPSRFHIPAEEPIFDVKIEFIHVVSGLQLPNRTGCRQFQQTVHGVVKIVPIAEITDKPGEKIFTGKDRDAWFQVPEKEITTFEVRFPSLPPVVMNRLTNQQ